MTPAPITYTGQGGYDEEIKQADQVFERGKSYLCIGGSMSQSYTSLRFEGIEGGWNSCLFDCDARSMGIPFRYHLSANIQPNEP